MIETPEHDKQREHLEDARVIGEFLEWLQSSEKYAVGQWTENRIWGDHTLEPAHISIQNLLAEYFRIDLQKINEEKRSMLDEIRLFNQKDSTRGLQTQ